MSASPAQRSFTPFPDLTGWRSSASCRSSSSGLVSVSHDAQISIHALHEAARRLGAGHPADLVVAAWAIVLTHLLSQEGDVEADIIVSPSSHVQLSVPQSEKHRHTVSALLRQLETAPSVQEPQHGALADNAVAVDLTSNAFPPVRSGFALFFLANLSKDTQHVQLSLQASTMVHNHPSAQIHLRQVGHCLSFLCRAPPSAPALSGEGFPDDLLAGDNPRPSPLLEDLCEHSLAGLEIERFEHQMERVTKWSPRSIALDFRASIDAPAGQEQAGNILWSYEELDRRAAVICQYIKSRLPEQPGTPIVALCLEKSPFTYVSILAVLKAGAAWCPIDTDWPAARREVLLEKSGARLVLTAGDKVVESLQSVLPTGMDLIRLDTIDYHQPSLESSWRSKATSDALAYLIWTSGTTGLPKAVGIQHRAAVQALRSLQRVIPHDGEQFRYLQFSAYNFDLMILDVFYTWGLGGTLCSSSRSMLLTNLVSLSNTLQVTHTLLTPAVMAMTPREAIPTLSVVINGGEKLSQVVADTWSVNCCLLNLYGPAEATLIAMNRRVPQGDQVKAPNIGIALPTTSCHALDSNDAVVLKGAVGQLVLGGHQCALGYIGEAAKTAEKFVDHPLLGRIYKTGDLVRQLWNGEFEYLGRSDDQIKVNGIRIELLEINATVRSAMSCIIDSETLVIKAASTDTADDDGQIVNFSVAPVTRSGDLGGSVIRTDDEAVELARQLMRFAHDSLPSYMVPSLFFIVTHFPRTSSAKIDREALRRDFQQIDRIDWLNRLATTDDNAADAGPEEAAIGALVAELCAIPADRVGRHTPFPSLGLNSIKAITLSHRLMQIGSSATVVDIVHCNTLVDLAARIRSSSMREQDRGRKADDLLDRFDALYRPAVCRRGITPERITHVMPVTPLQEALLVETLREPARYWLHRAYRLPSNVDVSRLEQALHATVERMEILRTCFMERAPMEVDAERASKGDGTGPTDTVEGFLQVVLLHAESTTLHRVKPAISSSADDWRGTVMDAVGSTITRQVLGIRPPLAFLLIPSTQPTLVAVMHHALYDQMTLSLFEASIAASYHGSSLPPVQPFSLALSHLVAWDAQEEAKRESTWQRLLSSYPKGHAVSFPNLSGRGTVSNGSQTSSYRRASKIRFDVVTRVAMEMETSVRPILQAAWASVLSVYCDTSDVLIGDSVSRRATSMDLLQVSGPVLDTLPIPIHLNTTFRQVIGALDSFHKEAIACPTVPLRQIRKMVQIPTDFPLLTSVFVFEPPSEESSAGISEDQRGLLSCSDDFGISVEHNVAVEVSVTSEGRLLLGLVARDAAVSRASAELLLAQWESAICQAIAHPDDAATSFRPEFFAEEVLSVSHCVVHEELRQAQIVPVFAAVQQWAQRTPNAVAVEFCAQLDSNKERQTLTYRELEGQSDAVAHHLREIVPRQSIVAVSLHRSMETYIILLAIFKAGLTYLPIDSTLPVKRKTALLKDSGATCLVWSSRTLWSLEGEHFSLATLVVDSPAFAEALNMPAATTKACATLDASDNAYILYTSGSTGAPKGCVLTHANLSSAIEAFRWTIDREEPGSLDQTTRFFARSMEAFDVALLESFLPLQVGGAIVAGPREVILQDVGQAMKAMQVTHAAVVPSLFYTQGRRVVPSDLPRLRVLIVGGERIAADIIKDWGASIVPLLNAYGPTEACIGTSIGRLGQHDSTGNIGRPFPGTQYLVLKQCGEGLRLALRGEAGELFIGGLQIGSYLGQANAASFTEWKGQRIYRTGDEVRLGSNDMTEYLGRASTDQTSGQVKLRGVRIELSEVDNVLGRAAKVTKFWTTRLVGEPAFLVSFVAAHATSEAGNEDLQVSSLSSMQSEAKDMRRYAKEHLPSYMVPRLVVPLARLPLAVISGKIDVKRLETWFYAHSSELLDSSSSISEKTLTQREQCIADELRRLFQITTTIGPSTDVFALGLDSLNVITLSSALLKRGFAVDVAFIMANASVEAIARGSEARSGARQPRSQTHKEGAPQVWEADITGVETSSVCPLLPLQESMVTQTMAEQRRGAARYVNVVKLACKGDIIDRPRLERSIEGALRAHDIYRTIFADVGGTLMQAVVTQQPEWQMGKISFEESAVQEISTTLDRIPPIRYCLTDTGRHLLIAIHHALYDGESLAALLTEVERRYAGRSITESLQFSSYVDEVRTVTMESKISYWERQLRDCSITPFPCLTGKRIMEKKTGSRQETSRTASLSLTSLRRHARTKRVTVQMIVLDAFARLYSRYVGEDDVVFGVVLGGRFGGFAQVHGPCINTVPFHYRTHQSDWQQQIQTTYGEALQNQHVSLPAICRRLQVEGSLFNALFSYMGAEKENPLFEELSSQLSTEYPLAVEVEEKEKCDEMQLQIVFDDQLMSASQASLFLKQLDTVLSSSFSSIASDLGQVTSMENEHPYVPTLADGFMERFKVQVGQQPSATAFVFADDFEGPSENISYQELDETSDLIARNLFAQSGAVVGVLMKQCSVLYPLLVAIWKAGKVFLPLDPSLPLERLEYMVTVAAPTSIVTAETDLSLAERLGKPICVTSLLDSKQEVQDQQEAEGQNLNKESNLERPAYIMFTSGSSGKPKGVQVSHPALAAAIYSWDNMLPHSRQSRILQLASPGFDVFLIEVCMPLALGFSFGSAPRDVLLNDLEATFSRLDLTMADLPAVLAATVSPENLISDRKLDWLMSGGDQIDDLVIQRWSRLGLVNAWGPTETTIGNTLGFVSETSSRNWIGRVYPTSSVYILETGTTDLVFRGCVGEIAVGGPQLADGYVGNAKLTEEKFVSLRNGTRVYRTGDRGRLLIDGSVECLGRMDAGQVKVNSQRVELREIEVQLKRHNRISDAAVLYIQHPAMQSRQLVAFFITRSSCKEQVGLFSQGQEARDAVAFCLEEAGRHLAAYMIPTHNLILASKRLPLTPNNKVDAKRLAAMYNGLTTNDIRQLDARYGQSADVTPWSKVEQELRAVVAQFCSVEENDVGRSMSFYRLGIDSISGFKLLKHLRRSGFTQLALRDILKAPNIAALAAHIARSRESNGGSTDDHFATAAGLDKKWRQQCDPSSWRLSAVDDIKRILPCTPLQEGLLLETLSSEGDLYVHHHAFAVDKSALDSVLRGVRQMVESHDILRTSFHLVDGQFLQAAHSEASLQVQRRALKTGEDMGSAVSALFSSRTFTREEDLARPPLQVFLLEGSTDAVVDFVLHHALYDGESLAMLFEEVESRVKGEEMPERLTFDALLPALLSQPKHERFIVEQVESCHDTLIGPPSSPAARPCHLSERVIGVNMSTLASFASTNGISLQVVALFAFSKLLAHLTKQRDVLFAQLFSLRDAVDGADEVIGPALNAVLTRVSLLDHETVIDSLARIQRDNDASREHRCASMGQVQRLIRKKRGTNIQFDSLFDFQNIVETGRKERVLVPWESEKDHATQYALNVQFRQQCGTLSLVAVGDSTVFTQAQLDANLEVLEAILTLAVTNTSNASMDMPSGMMPLNSLPCAVQQPLSNKETPPHRMDSAQSMTDGEQVVASAISELTSVEADTLNVLAPVTQFGLDSIMAIKLASLLRKKGISVGVVDILQGKTIEGISRRLAERQRSTSKEKRGQARSNSAETLLAAKKLQVSVGDVEEVLPLIPGQVFELAEFVQSKGSHGIYTFSYRINGAQVEEGKLRRAWMQLQARHSVLRTAFVLLDGSPRQVILRHARDDAWQYKPLAVPIETQLARRTWLEDACKIDVSLHSPPCAACLVSAPGGSFLVLRLHHAMYDAWTIAILVQDLWRLYSDDTRMHLPLEGDHGALVRHISREREELVGEAERYWTALLKDTASSVIGPSAPSSQSGSQFLSFPTVLAHASMVDTHWRSKGTDLGMVFIAAWARVLLRLLPSHNQVAFGLYHRGRSSAFDGVETVASNCMNVLPLVVGRHAGEGVEELSLAVKEQLATQTGFEAITSMSDILGWTKADTAPWNSYLNLLWDDGGRAEDDLHRLQDGLQALDPVALLEKGQEEQQGQAEWASDWRSAALGNMKTDINIDVHWDRQQDCINVALRYRDDIWTTSQAHQLVHEMVSHVRGSDVREGN